MRSEFWRLWLHLRYSVPPPILTATVPYTPDEAGPDPPTPFVAKAPDTPQAGKHELEQFEEAGSSATLSFRKAHFEKLDFWKLYFRAGSSKIELLKKSIF